MEKKNLLEIKDLVVQYRVDESIVEAVNGIKEDLGRVFDIVQSNAAASQECSAMVRELSEQARMLDQLSKT